MTQRRPPAGKKPDPDDDVPTLAPTMAPDFDEDGGMPEPMTIRDPTLEVERVPVRPKPKRKKKGAGPVAWILVILILGGIGAAVGIVLAQGTGAGGGGGTTTESAAASDDATSGDDAAVAATDDAAPTAEETAAAAATVEEVAVAVVDDVAPETAEEVAVAVVDDVAPETAEEVAVAVVDDVAPETAEEVAVAAADISTTEVVDDAAAVAVGDVIAPTDDAAVAAADAVSDVVVATAPKPPNPAEAKRLNDLGFAARKAGDNATAMQRYKDAIAADPDNIWAHYNYGCELALAGKEKEALAELTFIYKLGGSEAKRALTAARGDADFRSIRDTGQFQRLTR